MTGVYREIITAAWLVFVGYWLWGWRRLKPAKRADSLASTLLNTATTAAGFVLILAGPWRLGPLDARFLPSGAGGKLLGVALVLAGLSLAIWARRVLGTNWSGRVRIRERQALVRSGPYALVRHPIYTGMALAVLGMALAAGRFQALLGVALVVAAFARKARIEERFLRAEFGDAYAEYMRGTKFLVPFVV